MLEGSGLDGLSLEYSLHGDKWTEAVPGKLGEAAQARYVRLANAGQESVSAVLSKLAVTVENLVKAGGYRGKPGAGDNGGRYSHVPSAGG